MASNLSQHQIAAKMTPPLEFTPVVVEEFSVEAMRAGEAISCALAVLRRLKPSDVRALLTELDPADQRARAEATEALKFCEAIRGIG